MAGSHPSLNVGEKGDSVTGWLTVRDVGNGLALLNMSESRIFPRNGDIAFDGVHPIVISPHGPMCRNWYEDCPSTAARDG